MNRDELSKGITVTDLRVSRLPAVFKILAPRTNGREGIEFVVFADGDRALEDEVRMKAAPSADLDLVTNDAIRSDFYVISDFGLWGDDCGGMNHGNEV